MPRAGSKLSKFCILSVFWDSSVIFSLDRRVYTWFVLVYKISYGLGIVGYVAIMGTLFGLNVLFGLKPSTSMDFGILTIFYGLYFGVVARDFAEVLSESMAARIGVSFAFYEALQMLVRLMPEELSL